MGVPEENKNIGIDFIKIQVSKFKKNPECKEMNRKEKQDFYEEKILKVKKW